MENKNNDFQKKTITLPDGRYLIFYDFDDQTEPNTTGKEYSEKTNKGE